MCQYFGLLGGMACVPLVYCSLMGYSYYPPANHTMLGDQQAAQMLGLNVSQGIVLTGYNNGVTLKTKK
jgi:hypothetical protein